MSHKPATPLVLGLAGPKLKTEERDYLRENTPAAVILFARNIESPEQTAELCAELADLAPFRTPYIAIDQEGGRVQRVQFWGKNPPARVFGDWYDYAPEAALEACELNALLLAAQVRAVGATWVMGPVLDLVWPQTHAIIGDRAFSSDADAVAALGAAVQRGLTRGGCWGCLKHAPGHGRAAADSHTELPLVEAAKDELEMSDFVPFQKLAPTADFMMTAHIRYPALDALNPATLSVAVLGMMRHAWGFKGLIMADDVGMAALEGDYLSRIFAALNGGCDLVIASLSLLQHGMAGTVFDAARFTELQNGFVPPLSDDAMAFMASRKLPPQANADTIASATHKLRALWADGPAHMGYSLAL